MDKQTLDALFKVYPETNEERAVRDWMKRCKDVFTEQSNDPWTPVEVAALAIELGFDPGAVCLVMSHWNDALNGSRFERRQAMEEYRLEGAIKEFADLEKKRKEVKPLDLHRTWLRYVAFAVDGMEFSHV